MDWTYLFTSYDGRIGRQSFWIGHIAVVLAAAALNLVVGLLFGFQSTAGIVLRAIVGIAMLYPALAVDVKRLHDRDKSGWWILLLLVPVVGFIWFVIELGCLKGTGGSNRFGPDPLPPSAPLA